MASPLAHAPGSAEDLARVSQYLASNRLLPALPVLVELGAIDTATARALGPLAERIKTKDDWRLAWEEGVFSAFSAAGIPVICLKGAALARWLYPRPDQRARVDLDLFVSPGSVVSAEHVLAASGYRPQSETASVTQRAWADAETGRGVIDLHWYLSDQPALRSGFDFDRLWQSAVPLDARFPEVRRLDRVEALLHAVAHYYGSDPRHTNLDAWLLDMLLLARGLDADETGRFEARCREVGVSGLAARGLEAASEAFGVLLDKNLSARLRARGNDEWRTQLATGPRGGLHDLRLGLRGQPGILGKLGFLREQAFPSARYMRIKYPGASRWALPWLYVKRMVEGGKK